MLKRSDSFALSTVFALVLAGCGAHVSPAANATQPLTVRAAPALSPERVIYAFRGPSSQTGDAANPYAGLVADLSGALYGTTVQGGTASLGAVFKLTPVGGTFTEKVLHSFAGGTSDGANPYGTLLERNGSFYGTTSVGGTHNLGTVFRISASGAETVLYSFPGGSAGAVPKAGLIADETGALYGTTNGDGDLSCGCGVVFKLTPATPQYKETTLYAFLGGMDGSDPESTLIADSKKALYGTTVNGGGGSCALGCGTVFKLTPSGGIYKETVILRFTNNANGRHPMSGVIADLGGALYGASANGGSSTCAPRCGTIYKLTPSGTTYHLSVLYRFSGPDGQFPWGGLVLGTGGTLLGTTTTGGTNANGTVFELAPSGATYVEHFLYKFAGGPNDGSGPDDALLAGKNGLFYGTTFGGGSSSCPVFSCGTVFQVKP